MYIYAFEKLEVWKEAKEITKTLYTTTSRFPDTEKFGLVTQLRRASVSICSNIAEGSTRSTYLNQANFTNIAYGSTVEVLNQVILCHELGFLDNVVYTELRSRLNSLSNKLNALRNTQISKAKTASTKQINK